MAKQTKTSTIDCTGSPNRADGFSFLQSKISGLLNGRRQFVIEEVRFDDGSSVTTVKTNGLAVDEKPEPKSGPPTDGGEGTKTTGTGAKK
jgi:hypothetical protein